MTVDSRPRLHRKNGPPARAFNSRERPSPRRLPMSAGRAGPGDQESKVRRFVTSLGAEDIGGCGSSWEVGVADAEEPMAGSSATAISPIGGSDDEMSADGATRLPRKACSWLTRPKGLALYNLSA